MSSRRRASGLTSSSKLATDWRLGPGCYQMDPPLPEDDGWYISPRLKQSLVAYVQG
jgi:hypothetical protein